MLSQTAYSLTQANDATVGTLAWSNVSYIGAEDSQYAARPMNGTAITNYLKATNFGFAVPSTATIYGIEVYIARHATIEYGTENIRDSAVRIVKADGTIGTTNYGYTNVDWRIGVDRTEVYGSDADLWGEAWTPADVNDADFGAVLAAVGTNAYATKHAKVNSIRLTVYYVEAIPAGLAKPVFPDRVAPSGLHASRAHFQQVFAYRYSVPDTTVLEAWAPCYPDRIWGRPPFPLGEHRSAGLASRAEQSVAPLGWDPVFPSWMAGARVPTAQQSAFFTGVHAASLVIGQEMSWMPQLPVWALTRPRGVIGTAQDRAGLLFWQTTNIMAQPPCVEMADTSFTRTTFLNEAIC